MGASWTQWRGPRLVAFTWWGPMAPAAPPQDLLFGQSQLWEHWQMSGHILVVDWLNLSMHSFSMEAAASAHWWASLALVSSHSPEVSCLPLCEAQSHGQGGQVLADSGSLPPPGCSPFLHLRQSFKEDMISFIISHTLSAPHGGGPGNLFNTYT